MFLFMAVLVARYVLHGQAAVLPANQSTPTLEHATPTCVSGMEDWLPPMQRPELWKTQDCALALELMRVSHAQQQDMRFLFWDGPTFGESHIVWTPIKFTVGQCTLAFAFDRRFSSPQGLKFIPESDRPYWTSTKRIHVSTYRRFYEAAKAVNNICVRELSKPGFLSIDSDNVLSAFFWPTESRVDQYLWENFGSTDNSTILSTAAGLPSVLPSTS